MRKAIFTVITGNYDQLLLAPHFVGWDCILFIDKEVKYDKGWQVRKIEPSDNPILQSREYKLLSHIHLKEYDLVCYIDGNQRLIKAPPNHPIWIGHSRRKNIFEEAKQLIINGRFGSEYITPQIQYYKFKGYQDCGLYLNGFFVRDHSPEINKLHDIWYKETSRFTPRDQLTLPYSIWLTGTYPKNIQHESVRSHYTVINYAHEQNYDPLYHSRKIR